MTPTTQPPFPDAARTGRTFIFPCSTDSAMEFLVDGGLWLAVRVAGYGWTAPWRGCIEDINDDGTLVEADGAERQVRWQPTKS